MPQAKFLTLNIGNKDVDLGSQEDDLGFRISYLLEEPENFASKQGADPQDIELPATKNNDDIFNTFWNPQVEDLAPANLSFRELMPCIFSVNGTVPVLNGYAVLTDATCTDRPEMYNVTLYSANGQWVLDLQNFTLWDCVNPNTHVFSVATVEHSWTNFNIAGNGSDDFVYAPVRYRQPFDGTTLGYGGDDCVNIYHLKPAISAYWVLRRAFNQIGYTIKSQFFSTAYFQKLVLPWVWGDFYDINAQLVQGVSFKAVGQLPKPSEPPPALPPFFVGVQLPFWSGNSSGTTIGSVGGSSFWADHVLGGWNPGAYTPGTIASIEHGVDYITIIFDVKVVGAGTGYIIGDTVSLDNLSGTNATGTVSAVGGGGAVTVFALTFGGDASSVGYYAGKTVTTTATSGVGTGLTLRVLSNTSAYPKGGASTTSNYVFEGNGTSGVGNDHFNLNIDTPPNGYDDFMLYTFDNTTGKMQYNFQPPASLVGAVNNLAITFVFDLYAVITSFASEQATIGIECLHVTSDGSFLTCQSILPSGGAIVGFTHYPTSNSFPTTPTVLNFTIPNCNAGDTMTFRVVMLVNNGGAGSGCTFGIFSGGYLNNNPQVIGVPSYAYNPVTEQFGFITPNTIWSPLQSSLTMTGFLIQLGNSVNLQNYDAFRNFAFLDFLGGMVDMFNLEITTDNIDNIVTIEPMFGSVLPTTETCAGYFSMSRILDYTNKRDIDKGRGSKMHLFSSTNRQIDLTFKLDSNDGAQNIWTQRYKGVYLPNRTYTGGPYQNNINIDAGIIASVPGAARYMLPNRFAKGNLQMTNRFFSATMHCSFPQWFNLTGTDNKSPQLITIFPQDSTSADAFSQSFTPKLAFYGGIRAQSRVGGWRWIGDPASPYNAPANLTFELPFMAAVNYVEASNHDPVLSYTDENILGTQVKGLLSQFYRQRFAIMRNGQLLTTYLRLNLNDVCNWEHQECLMINGVLYALIEIDGYNPLTDESTPCTMWKVVNPEQIDLDNTFPSATSITNVSNPATILGQYDLRYARLLLFPTDVPQQG